VLDHASGQYDRIVNCGDFVDYGASPNEVVDWSRTYCAAVIRGNHDKACCGMDSTDDYNPLAKAAVSWTMTELRPDNLEWLRALPQGPMTIDGQFQIVHGSPFHEDEYLLEAFEVFRAREHMQLPLVFFGHTHLQIGFQFRGGEGMVLAPVPPDQREVAWDLIEGDYYLINPGSVGQPRDRDWRAAYALYDSDLRRVTLRRIEYDLAGAQRRILEAGLPPMLADRLSRGQ
jgi:diadenosine tetraphosphatase ApaH/serine/threonine PP2A family protein phosphatase